MSKLEPFNDFAAAVANGLLVAIPENIAIEHSAHGIHCAIALVPLDLRNSVGETRHLEPGDLLHADEVSHSGTAFDKLVSSHRVARLPIDGGVVALALAGRA